MIKRRKVSISLIVLLLFLFFAGGFPVFASGNAERPVFAYQDRIGDAPAILAASVLIDEGIFDAKRFSSGGLCAEALISGTAQVATMGDAVAVKLAARYPETIVLLGVHGQGNTRHRLVSRGERPVSIGVKFGTSTHAALLVWLEESGGIEGDKLPPVLIDMAPNLQISALAAGEIDALAASEPTPSIALRKIADMKVKPLEIPGREFPLLIVTTRKALQDYPEQIARLVAEIDSQAANVYKEIDTIASATGLEPGLTAESMSFHSFGLKTVDEYIPELDVLACFLLDMGTIPVLPDWSRVKP